MAIAYGCYDANMETKVEKFFVFFQYQAGAVTLIMSREGAAHSKLSVGKEWTLSPTMLVRYLKQTASTVDSAFLW